MAKLKEGFEKDYLDLLMPLASDGTVKNRRNLLVASFMIIAISAINKSLVDLRILGLNLAGSDGVVLLIIAIAIILFWSVMFGLHAIKDHEINKERKHLLEIQVEAVRDRMDAMKERVDKGADNSGHFSSEYTNAKSQYAIYERQQLRTIKAQLFSKIVILAEYVLPFIMSIVAICILSIDLYQKTHASNP